MGSYTNNRIVQIDFDASVTKALSGECKKLILTATQPCYVQFTTATVTALTGFYIPANEPVEVNLTRTVAISAVKVSSAGKLTILELI